MRIFNKIFQKFKKFYSYLFNNAHDLSKLTVSERLKKSYKYSPFTKFILEVDNIKGFQNYDDSIIFKLILELQSNFGLKGDLLEIGAYNGKSATLMFHCINEGEKLFVSDVFQNNVAGDSHRYKNCATDSQVRDTILKFNVIKSPDQLVIIKGLSRQLSFEPNQKFRFIHVDGGHNYNDCMHDLELSRTHLLPNGCITLDDYEHPDWPEVTSALNNFLKKYPDIRVLFDFNRIGAKGRKLYLTIK